MGRRSTSVALVLIGTLALQLGWIIVVPAFDGIDEIDHVYRAASVVRGEWRAGPVVAHGRGESVDVPASLVRAARPACRLHDTYGPDNCQGSAVGNGLSAVGSGSGSYNPVFYAVAGLPSLVLDGTAALYAMRLWCAALCALGIALSSWCLVAAGRRRTALTGLVVAMTPVFSYSTTVVAPNGIEMVAGVLLWSSLLTIGDGLSRRAENVVVAAATAAAAVLVTTRSLGPIFCLLIFALALGANSTHMVALVRRRARTAAFAVCVVALATAASAWWIVSAQTYGSGDAKPGSLAVPASEVFVQWPAWLLQSIAAFPFRNEPAPLVVYPLYAAALLTLLAPAVVRSRGRERAVLVATCIASALLPVVVSLLTLRTNGIIWQGRYGLPLAVGVAIVSGWLLERRPAVPLRLVLVTLVLNIAAGALSVAGVAVLRQDPTVSLVAPGSGSAWLVFGAAVVAATAGLGASSWAVVRSHADAR